MAPGRLGPDEHDDFAEMFDMLDLSKRGYLTMEEIQKFYESIFYNSVNDAMVKSVLRVYGGSDQDYQCTKRCFEVVLSKLEEKRNLEESAYWDFIAMDRDGTRLVNVKSCLLLAKSVNSEFLMSAWHDWLNSRHMPNSPISWCEFQQYLYYSADNAVGVTDVDTAFDNEMQSLDEKEARNLDRKYTDFQGILEDDEDYMAKLQQDRDDYQENIRYESSRLLNRWDIGGAEAVIYDDGTEMERQTVASDTKNSVTITDLFSALDVKYSMLREKIFLEMARAGAEAEKPDLVPSADTLEKLLHDIRKKEKNARKLRTLDEMLSIQGASVQHRYTALGVMGETAGAYIAKWEKAESRFKVLRSEGKTTDEINKLYEGEILNEIRGSTTNGELLIHLAKRQEEEKAYISKSLQFLLPIQSVAERLAIYASLHGQCLRAERHEEFENAAVSACLAERKQLSDFEKYNPDCSRQEKLSKLVLDSGTQAGLGQQVPDAATPEVSHSKKLGMVDSWLEVTRLLSQKHTAEREVMTHFLLSDKVSSELRSLKNESQKNLQAKRQQLMKQRDNVKENLSAKSNASEKLQRRADYFNILSTASAVYWENIRQTGNADRAATIILARLQVLQDVESEKVFLKMRKMNVAEIYQLRKEIYRSIRDEVLENISDLVLGALEISLEEKELIDLILLKYNKLRVKLFENFVKKKKIDSDVARNQLLEKLKIGEEKHRVAGNHAKLAKLSGDTFQIKYTLQEIMGPDASRYKQEADHYLEELNESGRKRKLINEPPDLGDITDSAKARGNAISELHLRYEDEVNMILDNVRASPPAEKAFFIAAEMAWQQWEILRFNLDDEFLQAALAMGLSERTKIGQGKIRLRQDNLRYIHLAQERLMTSTSLNTKSLQSISTSPTPAQSSLRRVLLCHASDWRKLYELLTDDSAEELREAARSMSEDERSSRLAEINAKRMALDTKSPDWQDDILSLLEEAASIKYVSRMQNLKQLGGEEVTITQSDVQVSIMADLQEEHDRDGFKWFAMALEDPGAAGKIKDLAMIESKSCVNVFNVLCKYEGQTDDDELLQALEDKYDSLRDKLLAEALMKQLGEKAWHLLTERERQERIFKLKMEERRLRKEGRYDELAKLLGDAFADDERLRTLMGMNKDEYDRMLQERLANRKRGGLGAITEEDEIVETGGDPLVDLTSRYEEEKEALLRMLAGQGARYMSERDRQLELARLRRELRKSEREERFGAAALVLGLAERNAKMEERLASDKKRQEELAKQRLAELRAKKSKVFPMPTISEDDENVVKNGNKTEMIDAVLSKLELLYEAERAWLVHILLSQNQLKPDQIGIKQNNPVKLADVKKSNEISERLHEIGMKIPKQVNVNQYKMPLTEAGFFRQALFVHELKDLNASEINREVLDTKTLAFLQDIQDMQSRKLVDSMASMSNEQLIKLQELHLSWAKQGISENIYTTFFSTFTEEDLLTKAFDGKFDAILAALVEKALIEKKGEKKWNAMSQPERDRLIAETMEKIKTLIGEGKTDEAAALLGDAANTENVLAMFGLKTDEEERERLESERLERRKQRIADGMSEEEADRLMEEERVRDEELLKKRRKNVLDLLKFDIDAQKDALLKEMEESNERLDAEKRRQLELARLRLQQRMMQRENDVNAVAHVLALSKMANDQLEAEKQRQLELARKRLEAYRNGKGLKEEKILPLKLPDGDDMNDLIDTIICEMESKHAEERRILMRLVSVDAAPGTEIRNKISSMDGDSMSARLSDLHELRRQWRNDDPESLAENVEEQTHILIEAAALNLETLKKDSQQSEESSQEEILGKLQHQQMLESSHLINDLPGKNASTLRVIAQVQWRARSEKWYDNIAECLLQKTAISLEEKEVLKAVDEKYDLMRDKLIAEALMRQMGEKDWNDLSELERQKKIIALKIKERKLKQEGKMDEAAQLISSLIKSDEELARLLGESKLSQKEELERKLEQRRKLKEERLAAGLSVDDNILDEEMKKIDEEEKKKRKNVLLLLQHNLDEEKEAILASLRKQDEAVGAERRRQLELARLRREQKQIAREDKVNAAAIIFNQAKKSEELLAASLAENRARQLALAKERLASRKQQKQDRESARALFDVAAVTQKLKSFAENDQDESVSAPERLLAEMDAKQVAERENLFLLLLSTEMDSEMRMQVSSMTNEQIKAEKDKLVKSRHDWREKRFVDLLQGKEEKDEGKKTRRRDSLAKAIVEQNTNFKRYMILQLEAEMRSKPDQNLDFAAIKNEMSINWLSEVQTSQATSVDAVHTLIADKSDEVLDMITYGQRKSRIESWNDNLNKVVMGILPPGQIDPVERQLSSLSTGSDERAAEDTEKQMKGLDEELEEQKKELEKRKKIGENIDLESAMAKLQQQHEAKRQALASDLKRQKQKIQERLAARREQRDEMVYEAHAAAALVFAAERRLKDQEATQLEQKSRQRSMMEEKLEARKKRRKELEASRLQQEEEAAANSDETPKKLKMAPPMGLKREKTVVDVQISNEEKEKMLKEMRDISVKMSAKLAEDREKHIKYVQSKIQAQAEKKRDKVEKIFANFEREKTIVLEKKNQEFQRQKTLLQDRMHNIRTGKTKTMKESTDKKVRDFDEFVNADETKGMSHDDRMALVAQNLEKKFLAEKEEKSTNPTQPSTSGDQEKKGDEQMKDSQSDHSMSNKGSPESGPSPRPTRMTEDDMKKKMKQRMSLRKKQKQEEESRFSENPTE